MACRASPVNRDSGGNGDPPLLCLREKGAGKVIRRTPAGPDRGSGHGGRIGRMAGGDGHRILPVYARTHPASPHSLVRARVRESRKG